MPERKLVYVRDDDLPLFERAAQDEETTSAVIAKALRGYYERVDAEAAGWQEYKFTPSRRWVDGMKPDEWGRPVKFVGRELAGATRGRLGQSPNHETTWTLYQTRKGRIVLVESHRSQWQGSANTLNVAAFGGLQNLQDQWSWDHEWCEGEGSDVPEELIVDAQEALGVDPAIVVE